MSGSFQDAQDLGISIELLPFSKPDDDFNVSTFYAVGSCSQVFPPLPIYLCSNLYICVSYVQDLLGLEGTDLAEFKALAAERFESTSFFSNLPRILIFLIYVISVIYIYITQFIIACIITR